MVSIRLQTAAVYSTGVRSKYPFLADFTLGHFRFFLRISDPHELCGNNMIISLRDNAVTIPFKEGDITFPGTDVLIYSDVPERQYLKSGSTFTSTEIDKINLFLYLKAHRPFQTLGDLNQKWVEIYSTEPLVTQIQSVMLICNNYKMLTLQKPKMYSITQQEMQDNLIGIPQWKLFQAAHEEAVPWAMIFPKTDSEIKTTRRISTYEIDFDRVTPAKSADVESIDYEYQEEQDKYSEVIENLEDSGMKFDHKPI